MYDYFPYGKQKTAVAAPEKVTQTFTGKELDLFEKDEADGEDGEGWYYFGARYYDSDIGLWTSCDPKHQFWSPYSYTGNGLNPVIGVDPNGEDFYALLSTSGHGHMGYIVGDNKKGFFYFSQGAVNPDAPAIGFLSGSNSRGGMDALKVNGIADLSLLTNSASDKGNLAVVRMVDGKPRIFGVYQKMAKFETTRSQDVDMILNSFQQLAKLRTGESQYNLYNYNCADAAIQAAGAGGIQVDNAISPKKVFDNMIGAGAVERE